MPPPSLASLTGLRPGARLLLLTPGGGSGRVLIPRLWEKKSRGRPHRSRRHMPGCHGTLVQSSLRSDHAVALDPSCPTLGGRPHLCPGHLGTHDNGRTHMSGERRKADTSPKGPVTREENPLSFGAGLLASKPQRPEGTGRSSAISTGLHVVFMGALVWGTVGSGVERIEDEVTIMEITQEMEAPPPPPPPPVDQPNAPFQGFQTLSVPDIVPAEIPPPGEVSFKAADFTGQGVLGGAGAGAVEDAVVAIGDVPSFTPFTIAPVLRNRTEVGRALTREYPKLLRDAGVGGSCEVWIRISAGGAVEDVQVNQSSGHPSLDAAALRVGQTMTFSPAMNRDKQVSVWVSIPITFQVQ